MVPLLTPVGGYYTTFYNHIAMVLTPLKDPSKTMVEPHFILQGFRLISLLYLGKFFFEKKIRLQFLMGQFLSGGDVLYPRANDFTFFHCFMRQRRGKLTTSGVFFLAVRSLFRQYHHRNISKLDMNI